jgi:hypothetical protein
MYDLFCKYFLFNCMLLTLTSILIASCILSKELNHNLFNPLCSWVFKIFPVFTVMIKTSKFFAGLFPWEGGVVETELLSQRI